MTQKDLDSKLILVLMIWVLMNMMIKAGSLSHRVTEAIKRRELSQWKSLNIHQQEEWKVTI